VGADPTAQLDVFGADQRRGLDRLQDVSRLWNIGHVHQFHYQTLEHSPSEGHPDKLTGFNCKPRRNGVGECP